LLYLAYSVQNVQGVVCTESGDAKSGQFARDFF
jgi:hypothetical protein